MRVSRKLSLLATVAVVTGVVGGVVASASPSPAPQTRFYFHSDGQPVNVADLVTTGTFDTTEPTSDSPSVIADSSLLASTSSDGQGDAAWRGAAGIVDGVITTVKLDFWAKSVEGDAIGSEDFDVSLYVGDTLYDLGQLTSPAKESDLPAHVVGYFSTDATGAPLAIDATGQPVTVNINGWFGDAQAAYPIFYDSADYPSGWSVNVDVPHTAEITPVATTAGSAAFTPGVRLPQSTGYGEPSLAIAPPGTKEKPGDPQTIYVSSPRGTLSSKESNQGSPIWRSDDGGATWTGPIVPSNVGPAGSGLGGGDTDIKTDRDGNVYFTDLSLANDVMSVSEDQGQTWFGSPASHPEKFVDDRQWLGYSAKGGGTMYLTFDGTDGVYAERAALDGPLGDKAPLVFLEQSQITDNASRGCICAPGSLTVDDSRPGDVPYVYVVLSSNKGLTVWRSDDNAATWTPHVIPGSGTGTNTGNLFEVSAVDGAGNLYVAWSELKNGTMDTFLAVSQTHGEDGSWRVYNASASLGPKHITVMPAITADGVGHVGLAFYATTDAGGEPDAAQPGTRWDLYYLESSDATANPPTFTVTDVVQGMHDGQVCTGGINCSTGGDRSLLDFFSVVFDADHLANIIYTHGTGTSGANAVQLEFIKEIPAVTTVEPTPTTLTVSVDRHSLVATLSDNGGAALEGQRITFAVNGQPLGDAVTDATGVASLRVRGPLHKGDTVTATFGGTDQYAGSSATTTA